MLLQLPPGSLGLVFLGFFFFPFSFDMLRVRVGYCSFPNEVFCVFFQSLFFRCYPPHSTAPLFPPGAEVSSLQISFPSFLREVALLWLQVTLPLSHCCCFDLETFQPTPSLLFSHRLIILFTSARSDLPLAPLGFFCGVLILALSSPALWKPFLSLIPQLPSSLPLFFPSNPIERAHVVPPWQFVTVFQRSF